MECTIAEGVVCYNGAEEYGEKGGTICPGLRIEGVRAMSRRGGCLPTVCTTITNMLQRNGTRTMASGSVMVLAKTSDGHSIVRVVRRLIIGRNCMVNSDHENRRQNCCLVDGTDRLRRALRACGRRVRDVVGHRGGLGRGCVTSGRFRVR